MKNSPAPESRRILIRGPYSNFMLRADAPRETREFRTFVSGPTAVDQSAAGEADINNVILRYTQTGQLPIRANYAQPVYEDVSEVPTLFEALQIVANAQATLDQAVARSQAQRATQAKPETVTANPPAATPPAPEA